jgi:hypothetical protein
MVNSQSQISIRPGYVLVERPQDYDVVLSTQAAELARISGACKKAGCAKVLVLGPRTRVRLSVTDIFQLGADIADMGLEIAVVEVHNAPKEKVNFLENVTRNRGSPIQFFDDEQEAKDWLGIE